MNLTTILAVVVLASFLVTLFLAIASYAAYKLRERRRPKVAAAEAAGPQFFERYYPPPERPSGDQRPFGSAPAGPGAPEGAPEGSPAR
ncbi:MAG: hypothetical protein MUF53_03965 [Gemmatimonadaceae bacterium]|nr:hypothetical protein [Gemmatimonadaceae bacterium]